MTFAEYLAAYATDVVQEWMRIIYLQDGDTQARVNWCAEEAGTFTVGKSPYSDEHGRFRLIVKVEEIEPLPPIGPGDDGALRAELSTAGRYIEGLHCQECCQDDEDPRAWCDCIGEDPPCKAPCRLRAHSPALCPSLAPVNSVVAVRGETWEEASFLFIEPGDMLRIPGTTDTADVGVVSRTLMRANVASRLMPSGKWWDEIVGPWDHFEVRASLAVNGGEATGLVQYPSDTAVEILCTPERKAQLILARAFIGTTKIGEK